MPDPEERNAIKKAGLNIVTNSKVGNDAAVHLANWLRKHPGLAPNNAKPKPVIVPAPTPTAPPVGWKVGEPGSMWQATNGSQAPGAGFPAPRPILDSKFYPVGAQLMALIVAVHRLLNPNMPQDEFDHNLRGQFRDNAGYCNKHGLNGKNSGFAMQGLSTCGATYRAVTGVLHRFVGVLWLEVEALDPHHLPPIPTSLSEIDMCKWFFPTTFLHVQGSTNDASIGSGPFPQFGGRGLIPAMGEGGTNWVQWSNFNRDDKVGLVPVSSPAMPFTPARPDVTAGLIA